MSSERENVSFTTVDGITLRGWLYPTASRSPAIIITPGLPCVKEMFVPEVAEAFQAAGINALVYDPRNLGDSDGSPRHEIDPAAQVSDYSDALTFLLGQPSVDGGRISFWGMSFSGTVALCAAALDKRAKHCIAACPYLDLRPPPEKVRQVLAKCMKDRESRSAGNAPTYLPMLTAAGTNPAGLHMQLTTDEQQMVATAQQRITNFELRTTVETYLKLFTWAPRDMINYIAPTPVFMLVPEHDSWSPPARQQELFGWLRSPVKKLELVPGKGHLTLFNGEGFQDLMQKQINFLTSEQ